MAISSSLSTALSGLNAHQVAIQTTSNNISNASNPDYVRERAVFSSLPAINSIPGDIGTGVEVSKIYRITDVFLFNRMTKTSQDVQKYSTMEKYLKEIATYFPDTQDSGLFKDIEEFFNAWQNLASNPNDGSAKVDLASKTQILSDTFHTLSKKLKDIQKNINDEINTKVGEANNILKEIADINAQITAHEANKLSNANELRDKRDALEKRLKELLGVKIFKNDVQSIPVQGEETTDYTKDYQITLGGYSLLNNTTYRELKTIDVFGNTNIAIQKEDFSEVDITKSIDGEIGGLLEVRGYEFSKNTTPKDGTIGNILSSLNALAQGMIRSVNSIYSYSAQKEVQTDNNFQTVSISPDLADKPLPIIEKHLAHPVRDGNMILDIYDNKGIKSDEITIKIDSKKSINEIIDDINKSIYDNNNNANFGAYLVNGEIKFVKGSYDASGNFSPENPESPDISPNVLVKDDGSLLFSALNEIEYMPLNKINTTKLPIPIENGSFDVVVYNDNGEELARRTITVDMNSNDPKYSTLEGIIAQINTPNIDDNNDNNPNNDVDDYYEAKLLNGQFILSAKNENTFIGLDNDSVNFGGAFGVNKFLEGKDAFSISLRDDLEEDPSKIHAYKAPNEGNNEVANEMLQLQFKEINFYKNGKVYSNTISGFYRFTTSALANETQNISTKKETSQTLLTSIQNEYYSISGVNIDEELINLEKFQRGYQANAKVITTINQMLDALFGIKQ
jgi:flagellar hook-associated protein 1 FlgK